MLTRSYNLKLIWIILAHKGNWNAHVSIPVTRYITCLGNINTIKVDITRICIWRVVSKQYHSFVQARDVKICEPADIAHAPPLLSGFVNLKVRCLVFI